MCTRVAVEMGRRSHSIMLRVWVPLRSGRRTLTDSARAAALPSRGLATHRGSSASADAARQIERVDVVGVKSGEKGRAEGSTLMCLRAALALSPPSSDARKQPYGGAFPWAARPSAPSWRCAKPSETNIALSTFSVDLPHDDPPGATSGCATLRLVLTAPSSADK